MSNPIINRLKFGWTKFGGARDQLHKETADEWTCQTCASHHPAEVPCFMMEMFEDEFIKICSKCQMVRKKDNIADVIILIQRVRILDPLSMMDLIT